MRKCMLLAMLLFTAPAFAQDQSSGFNASGGRPLGRMNMGPVLENETFRKKFIDQEFSPGTVMFKNSPMKYPADLIFDEFNNKLYFLKEQHIMEYNQPVKEFTIMLVKNGDSTWYTFRSGYAAVNKNTEETFYEVLVDGNYQLLKCTAKTNLLYKDEDLPEEKRNPLKVMLYGYFPDGKIVDIKKDKDNLAIDIPGHSDKIKKVVQEHNLKLNKDKQLVKLFEYLNEDK